MERTVGCQENLKLKSGTVLPFSPEEQLRSLAEDDNINFAFLIGKPVLAELAVLNHT